MQSGLKKLNKDMQLVVRGLMVFMGWDVELQRRICINTPTLKNVIVLKDGVNNHGGLHSTLPTALGAVKTCRYGGCHSCGFVFRLGRIVMSKLVFFMSTSTTRVGVNFMDDP